MIDAFAQKFGRLKNKFFSGIFFLAGVLLILATAVLVGFQLFFYLYKGQWIPMSLGRFVEYAPDQFYLWIVKPQAWIGLHKIIKWSLDIPLAFICFIAGYLFIKISDFIALFSD